MQITLPPALRQFIEEKVRDGQFSSPDDVIAGALETMKAQEELTPDDVAELRRMIQVGADQADRGELSDWNAQEVRQELRSHIQKKRGNA